MQPNSVRSKKQNERGVVVLLVAVVLLFVVAAMAALAIDLVTFYTARSEAQLAADGGALAGARVLANSGMTSDLSTDPNYFALVARAEDFARTIATQVAVQNKVGGKYLNAGEVAVSFPPSPGLGFNPLVKVQITRSDLPTFFARIWGRTQVTVTASATAEAYNPSGSSASIGQAAPVVAPICVKPWLLPNKDSDPTNLTHEIFNPATGAIQSLSLLGAGAGSTAGGLTVTCPKGAGNPNCNLPQTATAWQYFPGAQTSFPPPGPLSSACSAGFTPHQLSIAGCVQKPILCGDNSSVDLDTTFSDPTADATAAAAANCLTRSQPNGGDTMDLSGIPYPPFQFLAGANNPIAAAVGSNDVMVSDSLVTIPVVDVNDGDNFTTTPVKVVGFIQVFLNPDGIASPPIAVHATIINMAGCGLNATGSQAILGNGASPVPVRLITAP